MSSTDVRHYLAQAGGLLTAAGLARRWGVSKQYVGKVTRRADFPPPIPVDEGRQHVWPADEADNWRHRR